MNGAMLIDGIRRPASWCWEDTRLDIGCEIPSGTGPVLFLPAADRIVVFWRSAIEYTLSDVLVRDRCAGEMINGILTRPSLHNGLTEEDRKNYEMCVGGAVISLRIFCDRLPSELTEYDHYTFQYESGERLCVMI